MHEVLVNCLGGLSLPRKSGVRLTDRLKMTSDVYRGRKTTTQQQQQLKGQNAVLSANSVLLKANPLVKKIYCTRSKQQVLIFFSEGEGGGGGNRKYTIPDKWGT